MFSQALSLAVLAGVALAQTFSINTPPSIQQCQPAALSWTGGTGPYVLAAIPAGQVSAPALGTINPSVTGTSTSWTVNLAQGTAITIRITDSLGNIAYSSPITIQAGSAGCLGGASSSAGGVTGAVGGVGASASSVSGAASSAMSSAMSAVSSASSAVVSSASSMSAAPSSSAASVSGAASSAVGGAASSVSSVSRAASSTAAAATSSVAAGFTTASLNVPVLALAAALGAVAFGGFAVLA